MKNIKGKTAFITGASSGIGEAFAYEFAKQGTNLILTARSADKLKTIADKITKQYGIKVIIFTGDLSQRKTPYLLYEQITKANLSIDILVNNAGIGKWTNFLDETIEVYDEMLELNINALVKLTHLFLPAMLAKKDGGIINVASTGAFQPCPYVATYCASKAFVLSFSEALYGEYNSKGITIHALCPGNTTTGFQEIAKANTQGMPADTAQTVAQQGLKAFMHNKNYKIIGFTNYISSLMIRLLPRKMVINTVSNMMGKKVNFK